MWSIGGTKTEQNRRTWQRTCPILTLCTKSPTSTTLGLSQCLRLAKKAPNRRNHVKPTFISTKYILISYTKTNAWFSQDTFHLQIFRLKFYKHFSQFSCVPHSQPSRCVCTRAHNISFKNVFVTWHSSFQFIKQFMYFTHFYSVFLAIIPQ